MSRESVRIRQMGNRRRRQRVALVNEVTNSVVPYILVGVVKDISEKILLGGAHAVQTS